MVYKISMTRKDKVNVYLECKFISQIVRYMNPATLKKWLV